MYNEFRKYFDNGKPKFTAEDLHVMPTANLQMMRQALADRQFELMAVEESEYRQELQQIEAAMTVCKAELKERGLPC